MAAMAAHRQADVELAAAQALLVEREHDPAVGHEGGAGVVAVPHADHGIKGSDRSAVPGSFHKMRWWLNFTEDNEGNREER